MRIMGGDGTRWMGVVGGEMGLEGGDWNGGLG